MAGTIITGVILFLCSLPFFVMGVVQCQSRNPVGFWSGKEPLKQEQVTDVKAYNKKHGRMWIAYGSGFLISFLAGQLFGRIVFLIVTFVAVAGGLLVIIWYHNQIERKYLKKGGL